MKLAAYTIGDISRASSRLRSFYLFSSASAFSIDVIRPSRFREALSVDIVHIQKILAIKLFFALIAYRFLGIKVIYDIDDQPGSGRKSRFTSLLAFLGYWLACLLASCVTVDTEERKQFWKKFLPNKKIVVLNDIADKNEFSLSVECRSSRVDAKGFFWIGYACNFPSILSFLTILKNSQSYNLTASVEETEISSLRIKYPFVKFFPWTDGIAFDPRIKSRYMILNHSHDSSSHYKSENKMILAILAGYVPIVSRTPAYERLAKLINAEFLLFDKFEDVPVIIERLNNFNLDKFFDFSIQIINQRYSRNSVFLKFLNNAIE